MGSGKDADACKAYGAPAIMRIPGRVKMWLDGDTLRMQSDAGQQTRLLHFTGNAPRGPSTAGRATRRRAGCTEAASTRSVKPAEGQPGGASPRVRRHAQGGDDGFKAGYLRKNGALYSDEAAVTEDDELLGDCRDAMVRRDNGAALPEVPAEGTYITSSNFKKEPDDAKWHPTACSLD